MARSTLARLPWQAQYKQKSETPAFEDADVIRPTSRPTAAEFAQRTPFAQFQFIAALTFNATANGDTEVKHTLNVVDAENEIQVWPFNWEFLTAPAAAPVVYKPTGPTRRPWTSDVITLRCNVASATCQLLLTTKKREV